MATRDPRDIALAAMTIVECAQFYSAYNPSWFTIRTLGADNPDKTRREIYQGTAIATGMSLAFGILVAWLLRDPLPIYLTLVGVAGLSSVYIFALRSLPRSASV